MKNKKRRIILTIVLTVAGIVFLLPVTGFCILNWGILPPHKLTPLVVKEANKYINGELSCDKIELTFFETYPFLGVRITGGLLLSHVGKEKLSGDSITYFQEDTLLQFKRAILSVNPVDYLKGEVITIKEVIIIEPGFYGFVNEEGVANWDILLPSAQEDTKENTEELPPVDLQKVRVRNGHFIYDDRQADIFTELQGFSLRLNGSLINGGNKLAIQTKSSSIFFDNPSYTLNSKLELQLKSNLSILDNFHTIQLDNAELLVNNLPFTAAGSISHLPDSNRLQIHMDMALTISDMNDILAFIPDEYFKERKKIKANGSIVFEGNIHGELGDSIVPTINLYTKVNNGSFFMKGIKQGIELLEMDMDLHLNGTSPDSSFIVLDKLRMEGLNTSVNLEGKVMELLGSPVIDAKLKGKIDFTRLAEEFLNPDTLLLNGYMDADIIASFTMDDIVNGRYNNVRALGSFSIDQLRAFSKLTRTSIFIRNASFFVDSTRQASSYIAADDLLAATLKVDSFAIRYKKEINTMLGGIDITAKTSATIDTTAVTPLTTHIKIETFRSRLPDSVWIVANKAYLQGRIKPSASNKQLPTMGASITIDTLKYIDIPLRTGTTLAGNTFNLEALPYRDAMRQQRERQQARRGSTTASRRTPQTQRARQQQDSTVRRQVTTDTTRATNNSLLRNWEIRGSLSFNQLRMFSRMFPLPVRMEQTSLKFNTNTIILKDANLHVGKSNFLLNGELTGLRRNMLRGGKLEGKLAVNSEYIDCNQLIRTISRSMAYTDQLSSAELTAANEGELDALETDHMENIAEMQPADSTDVLFVVPDFLDVNLTTRAKKIDFQDLKLENVTGEMVIRNQSINLKRLDMHSNLGHGNLTLVYTARDAYEASAGFELDMQDILVDKLVGLFPSIDTLMPMLRSFEGVVDCQITATCDLDSTMSVILPSVESACYIYGENMVLLDGETFAEISKTLMFKNKERNVIDSISVDLAIRNNQIEVYPFLIEMDRYKVAVGGTHNMDMTFNYHLSVLKSPVPFKLGLDISGNLDKFKYKITKCRYKDLFKPAKIAELDDTRSSVRNEIREMIRKKIYENAPELAGDLNYREMRRRTQIVADPDPDGELPEEEEVTG
ncbi:MAG: AsmA family protein [Tannerellaceae bacterium]|nr:AsmA family protein [Tannerellaceae bacterium]